MRLGGAAVAVGVAAACVAVGLIVPTVAGGLAAALALAAVAAGAIAWWQADHDRVIGAPLTPFGPERPDAPPVVETPDVADLAREIAQAGRAVPPKVVAVLRASTLARLQDEHHIDPDDARGRDEVLGPELRELVRDDGDDVPLRSLSRLIDEVGSL